jgi:GxxExxY protein
MAMHSSRCGAVNRLVTMCWQYRKQERLNADERKWTQMNANGSVLDALSNQIISCAFTVANTLSSGFLEKVYENARAFDLREAGLAVAQQHGIVVTYRGAAVGEYFADLLVLDATLVELKTVRALDRVHQAHSRVRDSRMDSVHAARRKFRILLAS